MLNKEALRKARALIWQKAGYKPTEGQLAIHLDDSKKKLVAGGVQSGKSYLGAGELLGRYWEGNLYWLIGADYEMCRMEFGLLWDWFHRLDIVKEGGSSFPSRDKCRLELGSGIVIETKSAKYLERIAAQACDGIILCEADQMPYDIFTRSLERLITKDGWLLMAGTFESSLSWYADKFKDYQHPDNIDGGKSFSLPTWSNTVIYKEGKNDKRILELEAIFGADLFMERCGGQPVKPKGVVFNEFKSTLHTGSYPINPKESLFIAVDPGHHPGVYAVEFLQFAEDQIFVVDEIYEQFLTSEEVCLMVQKKPYFKNIEGGAIDIESKQQDGRKPVFEIWQDRTGLTLDTKRITPIDDGVNRLRTFLIPHPVSGEVNLHIDTKCRGLISEFGGCKTPLRKELNPTRGAWKLKMDSKGVVLSEKYEKTNCDAIKALIYGIVSRYGLSIRKHQPSVSYAGWR